MSKHKYSLSINDPVYNNMDEFERVLSPTFKTGEASLQIIYSTALEVIKETPPITVEHIDIKSSYIRNNQIEFDSSYIDRKIVKIITKIKEKLIEKYEETKDKKIHTTIVNLEKQNVNIEKWILGNYKYNIVNSFIDFSCEVSEGINSSWHSPIKDEKILTLNLKVLNPTNIIATIYLNTIQEAIKSPICVKITQALDTLDCSMYRSGSKGHLNQKQRNNRMFFIKIASEAAREHGKISTNEFPSLFSNNKKRRFGYLSSEEINYILGKVFVFGSTSALESLWNLIDSIEDFPLDTRKRFCYEIYDWVSKLERPLYGISYSIIDNKTNTTIINTY